MIQLVPHLKIMLAIEPVDFRQGIDRLAALCQQQFGQDPMSGALFVFRNRRATALKLLIYDSQGYWLCLKRFSQGKISWWPTSTAEKLHPLAAQQLAVLLYNGNPLEANFAPEWRKLPAHPSSTDQAATLVGSPRA